MKSLDSFISLLNFWPGMKTKAAAVGAFALAVIAAWNTMVPAIGFGPCELSPEAIAEGVKSCGVDLTFKVPGLIEAAVLALLGLGAANQPKNTKAEPKQ